MGTTNLNATGAATTNIATGGTGVLNLGNATGNTALTGTLTTSAAITVTTGNLTLSAGNVVINGAGRMLQVHHGAVTDFDGTATLVAGTVTVANTNIATGDQVYISRTAVNASTALGEFIVSIVNATSFTVTSVQPSSPASTQTGDVSSFAYFIVRPV